MSKRIQFSAMTAIGLISALGYQPAFAAEAGDEAANPDDSIIVTARRREERLTDVPVAVSVIGGAELQRKNVFSLLDVAKTVPSLGITPSNGRSNSANIMLRGQRQSDNTIFADPAVQVYINEVNSPRSSGLDTTAFDLESVQVLKGPQGTLFGRNSTGGALLLTTRKPGSEIGGYLRGYLEDPSAAGVEGAIDLPIAEALAIRIAGNYQYRKGYTTVIAPPAGILSTAPFNTTLAGAFADVNTGQMLDDRDRWVGRITMDVKPSDSFRSTFVVETFQSHENGMGTFSFGYLPGFSGSSSITNLVINQGYPQAYAQAQALDWHTTTLSRPMLSQYKMHSYSNVSTLNLGEDLVLKNVIGWRSFDGRDVVDQDGTFANIIINDAFNGAKSFSEELQLQGATTDKRIEWVVGGFYFRESGYDDVKTYTFKAPNGSYTNNNYVGRNSSLSGFAHLSYELVSGPGRTRIFGGIRYTHDTREVTFQSRSVSAGGVVTCSVRDDAGTALPGTACALTKEVSFNKATWQLGIDYQVMPDSLVYATVSTGYRSGGFNGRATTLAQRTPFRPETVMNYELGTKLTLDMGGPRFTADLAGYYTDYKDIQRTVQINNTPTAPTPTIGSSIVNAATARIWGIEGEFKLRPVSILSIGGHFSYTNARYKKFIETNPVTGVITDRSANLFFGVAPWQWGANLDLTVMDNDSGKVDFAASASHTDAFEMNDFNVPGGRSSSYTVVDAYLNWNKMFGTGISSGLYVKNLFDKNAVSSGLILTGSLEVAQVQHLAPRVIGGMVRIDF